MERIAIVRGADEHEHERFAELAGVQAVTVLAAGSKVIEHLEVDSRDAVAVGHDCVHEEIFAWSEREQEQPRERAGLLLRIKNGQEDAYREWLGAAEPLAELEAIWRRNNIYRHDVLASGTSAVAFYECRSRFDVLKAFREPEALAMLMTQLAPIFDLDPHMPISLFEETFAWERSAASTSEESSALGPGGSP